MFTYIPFLKFKGLSDLEIKDLQYFSTSYNQTHPSQVTHGINMQPLKVQHKIKDIFLEL